MRFASIALLSLLALFLVGCPPGKNGPRDHPQSAKVINMIPRSLSGETNQDSEPFLAANPERSELMAASAFTPNPFGGNTAPIYVSINNGNTWTLNNIVVSSLMTSDITLAITSANKNLYAGILRRGPSTCQWWEPWLSEQYAADFTSSSTMTVQSTRCGPDQPFVVAKHVGINDRIYVGNNDFGASGGRTATVDVSLDGGNTWNSVRIESRSTAGQDGPSVRPTVARDGTVYAAFFGWRNFSGGVATSDVVVVRDDSGATGSSPFTDLVGTDGLAGRRVVQGVTIPWSNAPTLGQERIGSTLSIAVDPNNSDAVYVAWADRVGNGDIYTIHVRRSMDRGANWSGDLRTIRDTTNVALAIAGNGTVGWLYQQVTGSGSTSRWETRLEQTRDGFRNVRDTPLANVPANTPAIRFLPYIGDYNYLLSVKKEFRGVFSANNTPDRSHFPQGVKYQRRHNFNNRVLLDLNGNNVAISIDPFYFRVPVMK